MRHFILLISAACIALIASCKEEESASTNSSDYLDDVPYLLTSYQIANGQVPTKLDGVILLESQNLPGALRTRDVENASHFFQRRDQRIGGVWDMIDNEFNRDLIAAPVFRHDDCSLL